MKLSSLWSSIVVRLPRDLYYEPWAFIELAEFRKKSLRTHDTDFYTIKTNSKGDRTNQQLDLILPVLVLLVRDEGSNKVKEIKYPETEPFKADNLKKWIWKTSGVYLPLPGCLEAFDKLADKMMESGR